LAVTNSHKRIWVVTLKDDSESIDWSKLFCGKTRRLIAEDRCDLLNNGKQGIRKT